MAIDDLRRQGGGGGQKSPILRRHSLWTAPNMLKRLRLARILSILQVAILAKFLQPLLSVNALLRKNMLCRIIFPKS